MTPTLEKARTALFESICATAMDADCCALQDGRVFFDGDFDLTAAIRAVLLAIRSPDEDVLRAYYERQFPPTDAPAGGFSRWATWDEARETQGPRIQAGLNAAIDAIIGEETA